jgi:peptide deformylase
MEKQILQVGDKLLFSKSEPIEINSINGSEVQSIITDLKDTLYAHQDGGAGLSAVQIGIPKRVFIYRNNPYAEEYDTNDISVIINPKIKSISDEKSVEWEGCLSISSNGQRLYGPVERSSAIQLSYYDENGEKQDIHMQDFMAHVVQHEIDHLNGKLFLEYVKNPRNLWQENELDAYIEEHGTLPPVK